MALDLDQSSCATLQLPSQLFTTVAQASLITTNVTATRSTIAAVLLGEFVLPGRYRAGRDKGPQCSIFSLASYEMCTR